MPRTDENNKQLKAVLDYILDGEVEAREVYEALMVSSSSYYRRIKERDYPDADELRKVAVAFGLSYPDLQVRFGLMSREEVEDYVTSRAKGVSTRRSTKAQRRTTTLAGLPARPDASPL